MTLHFDNPLLHTPTRPLPRRLGVVGAGTIGPDIAYYLKSALPDTPLCIVDVAQAPLDKAMVRVSGYVDKAIAKGKMSQDTASKVRQGWEPTLDYGKLAGCDWVIEAATEDLALKHRIFAAIEAAVGPDAIITSNTSSIPAARLFDELARPERATVTHFFAPAFKNPVVEVIAGSRTDPNVVAWLRWLFCQTGKLPLLTADATCFMLDRVFDNWCNDAALLLDRATAAEIDTVAGELVQAGPFFVLNLARGNPIVVEANTLQACEEGSAYAPSIMLRSVDTWKTVPPQGKVAVTAETADAIRDRLTGVLFSQAYDVLDRGIAQAADLDLGCVLALGFKKGPLTHAAELGEERCKRVIERFGRERPGMPLPKRPLASYPAFRRHVLVDEVDGVKVLTMRRPQAMNALDDVVTDELLGVIREHENVPTVRGFVIVGYGPRAFCAGADIGRFPEVLGDAAASTQYARDCSRLLVHLDGMKKPVVAAVNGMALGGGLELAIRCHAIVAQRDAYLQFPEVTLGIAPGLGGLVVPYRRWPTAAPIFHDMLRLATRLDAVRAAELGVVDVLTSDYAELVRAAVRRVGELSAATRPSLDGAAPAISLPDIAEPRAGKLPLSREVVSILGRAIEEGASAATLSRALERGYAAFGASACTAAAREGVGAFIERRKPDFVKTG